MRGLYIGRFQPFHLGHQAVIEKISSEVDEIVIVVGSAQASHTLDNPFTAGERLEMVYGALRDIANRCYAIPLQDMDRNAIWISHVRSMIPAFDTVYSNNPLVVQLFKEAGFEVRKPLMVCRESYSGTAIRKMMVEGDNWRRLLPDPVARIIDNIRGVERLKNVSKKDIWSE